MKKLVFIDTEVSVEDGKIKDFGAITVDGESLHTSAKDAFLRFIDDAAYLCGHNIIHHDLKYINKLTANVREYKVIDTLYLSPLLFPKRPYHKLIKDDKLLVEHLNNPLNDSKKAKELFDAELSAYYLIDGGLQRIYYALLHNTREFKGFFEYLEIHYEISDVGAEIKSYFYKQICDNVAIDRMIQENPIPLAYCLAIINTHHKYSITPAWVLKNYPQVDSYMDLLRNNPCLTGCSYCNMALDPKLGLKNYFGYDAYRTFDGEALQEKAVRGALNNKSLLVVFPTGGGKSITFQVPALMAGETARGLTVVISPLQSLMKDQVDNLEANGIIDSATINGLLDPVERKRVYERVEAGDISILYISPESLRSRSITRLLLGRKIVRFVIDEAHCFSAWGQDFRVDYLYIGEFIKELCEKKQLETMIPVSCFTATAKQHVIADIQGYFEEKLGLELELFTAGSGRKNLQYKVIKKSSKEDKYNTLRQLIDMQNCPTIIYVSRTKLSLEIADRLCQDGYIAKAYNGKMDKQEKSQNQEDFIAGRVQIMVATSAFGMGVDKKDIGLVVHFQISDSLENYVQEAGRAARDQNLQGNCYILYDEEDLNSHFSLLNQTKLNIGEIQQIWKAVKEITRFRSKVSNSALEIARKAGWDDSVNQIESRVTMAIAALEDAGYLKRGQNMPRVYANSIMANNMMEAADRIRESDAFIGKDEEFAKRIIQQLISARSRKSSQEEEGESRVDYISDHLGIKRADVIRIVQLLRTEGLLADTKDLVAYLNEDITKNKGMTTLKIHRELERYILEYIEDGKIINLKELNEGAENAGLKGVTTRNITTLLNYWEKTHLINREKSRQSKHYVRITFLQRKEILEKQLHTRSMLSEFIINYLYEKVEKDEIYDYNVEFSVLELKQNFEFENRLIGEKTSIEEVEDILYYLSCIGALKIEGGFLVLYNRLSIERLELDNRIKYKIEDYKKLELYYKQKMQQIHIVGEYANKMLADYKEALTFVNDYFQLNYSSFLVKYFKGAKGDAINKNITPSKFKQLFGELSPAQLSIINDRDTKYIVVAAGPGSGKTRILVHKLASLLLMEDVKHEQLLMVTFSRAAATEFKKRLIQLIGPSAHYVEIKTFHSYCFDMLGKVGSIEKSKNIIEETTNMILSGEIEPSRITKSVMVIDEAQDMNVNEFNLVNALVKKNEDMRLIAVGDDDQNIYAFRGSSSEYMQRILKHQEAKLYELVENYRSKMNLVEFTNHFVARIPNRMKHLEIKSYQEGYGSIEITYYHYEDMMGAIVTHLLAKGIKGTLCILTKTNQEALQFTACLLRRGINAQLIQSNEKYRLENLDEIRFLMEQFNLDEKAPIIDNEVWDQGKRKLFNTYKSSKNIDICKRLLRDFEETCGKYKYVSDFKMFLWESNLEDFYGNANEKVYVSTMHKSKGREFDHIIIMLDHYMMQTDENKRLLYVAMTRARDVLQIHVNDLDLHSFYGPFAKVKRNQIMSPSSSYGSHKEKNSCIEGLTLREEKTYYEVNNRIVVKLSYSDVFLDYFYRPEIIAVVNTLQSGDTLRAHSGGCDTMKGISILKFSSKCRQLMASHLAKGYRFETAKVDYVFYWKKEDSDQEVKIVLPEIYLVKE
jgi:ATP-dependent DNA helicase RecQ